MVATKACMAPTRRAPSSAAFVAPADRSEAEGAGGTEVAHPKTTVSLGTNNPGDRPLSELVSLRKLPPATSNPPLKIS